MASHRTAREAQLYDELLILWPGYTVSIRFVPSLIFCFTSYVLAPRF